MKSEAHKEASARAEIVRKKLSKCTLCPRLCKVNRTQGEKGFCGLDDTVRCFREMLHPSEERLINPSHQIYFAGCNLRCGFCSVAEWNIHTEAAPKIDYEQIAIKVKERKKQGAKTLNLLGGEPILNLHGIFELLGRVRQDTVVVLNSNMFFAQELMPLLEGFIDVYLADFKCGNDVCARNILWADNYVNIVSDNILTAAHQADIIVRHLVLPGHFDCCTKPVLDWIKERIQNAKVSLRGDYVPPAKATSAPIQYLDKSEYEMAVCYARNLQLNLIQ